MNKTDIQLIGLILVVILVILVPIMVMKQESSSKALVYRDNELILEIDLTDKSKKEYKVMGENGPVYIVSNNGKVKVKEEDSPLHLCSKQGDIESSYESIVCLPNKIVIKMQAHSEIDTIVK